ncbi:hypothetical protein [Caulobacter sp. 602-1]|uniref:hypothetical protein n=1 Tax=Caulobacter sp. 602-1 TaxID=2492472 RepID=UPI000F63C210|nr:hypothetical protein [Caulobacter sp. 602-1]RRN63924.1 hypothetical protein EIK80_14255 [Caulobacter sp. 602-1]
MLTLADFQELDIPPTSDGGMVRKQEARRERMKSRASDDQNCGQRSIENQPETILRENWALD